MLRKKDYMRKKGTFKFCSFKTSFFYGFNDYKTILRINVLLFQLKL